MIYFNNFDLLKEREQLHNTCSSYTNTSEQVKLKKKSSEIKKTAKYYSDKKHLKKR